MRLAAWAPARPRPQLLQSSQRTERCWLCYLDFGAAALPRRKLAMAQKQQVRDYKDYIRATTTDQSTGRPRSARIPLRAGSVFGLSATRGTRAYQEDASSIVCLQIPSEELRQSLAQSRSRIAQQAAERWNAEKAGGEELAGQVLWVGCFDGHGGQAISGFLRSSLHDIFERVRPELVTDTVQYTRSHGGYFRRFNGGLLERWVRQDQLRSVRAGGPGGTAARARAAAAGERNPQVEETSRSPPPRTLSDLAASLSPSPKGPSIVHSGEEVGETASAGPIESPQPATTSTERLEEQSSAAASKPKQSDAERVGSTDTESGTGPVTPLAVETPPASSHHSSTKTLDKPLEQDDTLDLLAKPIDPPDELKGQHLSLAERATLAWLTADRMIQAQPEKLDIGGSTASVALIHSLDMPAVPWYSSKLVSITTAHVGDTRMLLCAVEDGHAIPLTNYHHPDDRAEADRLRKLGAGMITDSFGEARWMGALANTRAFGDSRFKRVGVTAEPEVIHQIIKGDDYAFLIAFSDGVGGVMSDQEIVDLCRGASHPSEAAKAVMSFAEELGTDDNCTVICVPLRGWGKVKGEDTTRQRREFRRSKVDIFRDSRQ